MFEQFLYDIVDWIQTLFQMMDSIILLPAGELVDSDLSLFDVYVDFMVIVAVVQLIFGLRTDIEFETDSDMSSFYWDDD